MEEKKHFHKTIKLDEFSIVKDGIRDTTFGNVAGGTYNGLYRYYIIEFPDGNNNIVSIAIFGTIKTKNDPKFKTRNSYTSLIVAIDDYDKKHSSLQLRLDAHLVEEKGSWRIYHNGRLSSGRGGSSKSKDVIRYCQKYIPDLIFNGRVYLGKVPKDSLLTWKNCNQLIINLIRYAIVRDKFRKKYG